MALIVQKYGGTSVGNPERIRNCAARILQTQREGHQVVAVVSAMSGVTDSLIRLAREVSPEQEPSEREMDVLLSTGEQTTIALTANHGIYLFHFSHHIHLAHLCSKMTLIVSFGDIAQCSCAGQI